jgi:hypothetical protein
VEKGRRLQGKVLANEEVGPNTNKKEKLVGTPTHDAIR